MSGSAPRRPRVGDGVSDHLRIHDVAFTPANARDRANGLLGYVRCRMGNLRLDGLALRRTADGGRCLAFPRRRDRAGLEHPWYAPVDDAARLEIERQVFEALGLREAE